MKKILLFFSFILCLICLSSCQKKANDSVYEYVILTIEGVKEVEASKITFIDDTHLVYKEKTYTQDKEDKTLFVYAIANEEKYRDIYYVKILATIYDKANYIEG